MFVPRSVAVGPRKTQKTQTKDKGDEATTGVAELLHRSDAASSGPAASTSTGSGGGVHQARHEFPLKDEASGSSGHYPARRDSYSDESDEEVLSFSKQQRWPSPGEPVCVVCGRYGAYIVDRTDDDVCSLECKAKCLMKRGIHLSEGGASQVGGASQEGAESAASSMWVYREHPEVTAMTPAQCDALYKLVCPT